MIGAENTIKEYISVKTEEINNLLSTYDDLLRDEDLMFTIEENVFEDIKKTNMNLKECHFVIKAIFNNIRCKIGILNDIFADEDVCEIMVNGHENIFYERKGKLQKYNAQFNSQEELEEIIRKIAAGVHREINELHPIVDATLEDGSRANGVYKNIAIGGPALTIRKFKKEHMTMENMVENGSVTEDCKEMLKTLVQCGYNIFVSGGTSSGKTTFLNALSEFISPKERLIVIEDSKELQINRCQNLVHLQCRNANSAGVGEITIGDLIKTSLRMRPDRIIIGEVRGKEVVDMLQSFNTGHDGGMTTGHGNSIAGMLFRLESMYLSGVEVPMEVIKSQICTGLDIFIQLARLRDGKRKVVEVGELVGYENGKYKINMLFNMNESKQLVRSGNKLVNRQKLMINGSEGDYEI